MTAPASAPAPAGKPSGRYRIPDRARRIDAACDRFEARWRAGRRPRIADELTVAGADDVAELLRELTRLEAELAREAPPASAASLDDDGDRGEPGPGDRIGRYVVLDRMDAGGEATVYRVLHVELDRPFVLKLSRRRREDEGGPAAEGRLLAGLHHPGLVPAVDLDVHDGRPYLVMESVPGLDLCRYADRHRPAPRRCAAIVAEAARVVAFLHDRGILHQDLKPSNLLIGDDGRVRIIDLGHARPIGRRGSGPIAWGGRTGGTPSSMSPEQAEGDGDRITTRTDVFGLGAVLYELLCGRPPHRADTPDELAEQARAGRVVPPRQLDRRIPRRLEAICLRALARDPADRYAGALEMERALRRYLRRPIARAALVAIAALLAALSPMTRFPAP